MHWIKKIGNESCSSRRGTSNDTKLDPPLPPPGGGGGGKIKNLNRNPHFLLQIWILQKKVPQFDLRLLHFGSQMALSSTKIKMGKKSLKIGDISRNHVRSEKSK